MKTVSMKITFALGSFLLIGGCGDSSKSSANDQNPVLTDEASENETTASKKASSNSAQVNFQGFIPSAFEVTVDGSTYLDLEDFYTQELTHLPDRVKEAGYSDVYDISFDADIGFTDLWSEMTVYIVSDTDRGYFGKGQVVEDGSFTLKLPAGNSSGSYKVRANKRIGIILKSKDEIINICYNFSAMDQSVSFDEQQKPIILRDFVTKITTYACAQNTNDGLNIPEVKKSSQTTMKFELGQSKHDILNATGANNLYIDSPNKWCFTAENFAKNPYCALQHYISCQCALNFNDEGGLASVENIAIQFLGDSLIY